MSHSGMAEIRIGRKRETGKLFPEEDVPGEENKENKTPKFKDKRTIIKADKHSKEQVYHYDY